MERTARKPTYERHGDGARVPASCRRSRSRRVEKTYQINNRNLLLCAAHTRARITCNSTHARFNVCDRGSGTADEKKLKKKNVVHISLNNNVRSYGTRVFTTVFMSSGIISARASYAYII